MDVLNDNELGFITNTLGLETNPLFNDELNLNTISHDYIKSEDDLFLTNDDEHWLSDLDNVNSYNPTLSNQSAQNSINHHNSTTNEDPISTHNGDRSIDSVDLHNNSQNFIFIKKKRKLDQYENSNTSFMNGLFNDEVDNVIEISDLGSSQTIERTKSTTTNNLKNVIVKKENQSVDEEMNRMSLKAAKILGKPIKHEYDHETDDLIKEENEDDLEEDYSDQDENDDLDDDEEIDELLKFPVSSSILDDQCGSPSELNHLIHDSDSGSSSHFDDGYLSSATSTNFKLNSNNQMLLGVNANQSGRRQGKNANNILINNQSSANDQLFQVHNYSCIKQDKFLTANNQQLTTNGNQLVYLKHDGLLNGNYTSSNSSLSGGSNSSSPTQSPNARKSANYASRRQLSNKDDQTKAGLRSANGSAVSLNKIQQATNGRGSRSKPITDLHLTDEERRLLKKEGYTDFPMGDNPQLSKLEEKILRKIRRKIRNKRSAQCSRQRKKEYLEELEKKYSKSTSEVQCLKSEVLKLRKENFSLISKLQKLLRNNQDQQSQLNESEQSNRLGSSKQLPEQQCGEHLNKPIDTNEQQQQQIADSGLMDDRLDDLFEMLPTDFEFDNIESFELDDLNDDFKDDGLLRYVNQFSTNDDQLVNRMNNSTSTDYSPQAPVKTSLFLLVLCFVLMFVPFLRPDSMDNGLTYLEYQIGQNELISTNQITSTL